MYPVSQKFLQVIDSNSRKYYWTGTITTKKKTYEFGEKDILKGSGYITRSCCGNDEIELGSVYASEMGITLFLPINRYTLKNAEIKLFFHLKYEDGTEEKIPMGVFEITEANRMVKTLEIKAYDYMLRFDKKINIEASSGKAYDFLTVICEHCKVELAQTKKEINNLTNAKETLGIYSENDIETYRDLLYYLAQVLGCVCQINREGKLELIPYKKDAVRTIEAKHRYDSSYSDFVTKYTSVSSTNLIKEKSEYYALDVDDGLTMKLGANPLLQFGLKATRKRLLEAILEAISTVEYVPFDSNTIGNPALDPMDCIVFSGGHADDAKISCITSITYSIHGKMTIKGVGKNPKLAGAKSRGDKGYQELVDQIKNHKTIIYDFMNMDAFEIEDSETEVLSIDFITKKATKALFQAEILMNVVAEEENETISGTATIDASEKPIQLVHRKKANPKLFVKYRVNNQPVEDFMPQQIMTEGKQIVTLFFPITGVGADSDNHFSMTLRMTKGKLTIGQTQIRAIISGQGLVAGIGEWNGRITLSDTVEPVRMKKVPDIVVQSFKDRVSAEFEDVRHPGIAESLESIMMDSPVMEVRVINDRLLCEEVIQTFHMDCFTPGEYDENYISVTEENAFCLRHEYEWTAKAEEAVYGRVQVLDVDTLPFESIVEREVTVCGS